MTRNRQRWTPFAPVALAFGLLAGGLGCSDGSTPEPEPDVLQVTSATTRVEVELSPFQLRWANAQGALDYPNAACSPFAIALRPDSDTGELFHFPQAPGDDLIWVHAGDAQLVQRDPLVLEVSLVDDEGRYPGTATVEIGLPQGAEPEDAALIQVRLLTDYNPRAVAMIDTCFGMVPGEHAVGGGERFDGVDLGGKVTPLFFQAPGPYASATNEAHAPVPFIATQSGLGVFFETERVGAFDLTGDDLHARFAGGELVYDVTIAPILESVAAYGRHREPARPPPLWALAPMQWRNEVNVAFDDAGEVSVTGQDQVLDDAAQLRALDIPNTAIWIDAPWETGLNTFAFNAVQFPDPAAMLQTLNAQGFRVMVWATEHLNRSDDSGQQPGMPPFGSLALHDTFAQNGWLVGSADGPFHFRWPRGDGAFVDFTNPDATAAWRELMRPLLQLGVRGFKLDYGETMRADLLGAVENNLVTYFDGSTNRTMHTRYSRLYHEAFLAELDAVWPGDNFVITRTGGIFDQSNGTAIWPGDLDSDFSRAGDDVGGELAVGGLPAALSGALSLSMSGYPLYGSDIGGFRGPRPTPETLLRWAQFGALCTVMQLGGGARTHNPWEEDAEGNRVYGEEAVTIYRRYARLHMDLWPTFLQLVAGPQEEGQIPLRPAGVVMGTEEAWADADAFFVGPNLYAAPVTQSAIERDVVVPDGAWLDWWTGAELTGPATQTVSAPLDTLPLYQRAGSIVVLGDPRLMTLVDDADPDVADLSAYGDTRVLRTSAGPDGSALFPEAPSADTRWGEATQQTTGDQVSVVTTSIEQRRYVVDLWLRDNMGPQAGAPVRVDDVEPEVVQSEAALLDCEDACVYREPGRIRVLATGGDLVFTIGAP